MKKQKGTFSSIKTGIKSKSRSGAQFITKSLVTLRDRVAANMAAFTKAQKYK